MPEHRKAERSSSDWDELADVPVQPLSPLWRRICFGAVVGALFLGPGIAYSVVHRTASPSDARGEAASPPAKGPPATVRRQAPSLAPATAAPATIPAGQVLVLVANGSDHGGAAARTTAVIAALGYRTAAAVNAILPASQSTVFYQPGYGAAATALSSSLAGRLGTAPGAAAMPARPPVTSLAGAQLLVVLGSDERI